LDFYDSHAADAEKLAIPGKECTGHEEERGEEIPTACMLASSTKLVPKEDPEPDNPDKTAANLEPDKPHPTPNAFKDDDSYWMSATKHKDEWLGVQFENPTDVLMIKMQVLNIGQAPPAFVIEKSMDGENWARAAEVLDTRDWADKLQTFKWAPMDTAPTSVFAIRSQKDPSWCVGVKEIPDPEEPELVAPTSIDFETILEMQRCTDKKNTQFWYFNKDGRLLNAAGDEYMAHAKYAAGGPAPGFPMSVGRCVGECTDKENMWDFYEYTGGSKGGFMRFQAEGRTNHMLTPPTTGNDKKIAAGPVIVHRCGKNNAAVADIADCPEMEYARFELSPMFQVEPNKQAINCSPYSHSHAEPQICNNQLLAQALCAKDKKCMAYNWVDDSAEGANKDQVWLCYEIHDVHLKTERDPLTGWELGIRMGFSEDLIEEYEETSATKREL
jgi:hypothetical protein